MPILGLNMRPYRMSWFTMRLTVSTGMAKPMPAEAPDGEYIAVLTPTSLPFASSSGPPLLPGLIDASVWTQPLIGRPATPCTSLPTAETMPCVSVESSPNGLPMANTDWPTNNSEEEPTVMGLRTDLGAHFQHGYIFRARPLLKSLRRRSYPSPNPMPVTVAF